MDEWQFLDEVDVLAKWPTEHKKAVLEPGAKWKERKEGLEALNAQIEQNPRLSTSTMTIYGELMDELRKILDRESNIVVVTTAIRTVELLAQGLRQRFAGFIGMVVPFLIKRAKDKKKNVRDAILAAMGAVADTTTSERLQKDLIDWFGIPSPESKQTLLHFIYAYFCRQCVPDIQFIKTITPLIVKASSESDVTVRDKACQALGSIKRLIGDTTITAFLGPISTETAKIEKINQYQQEAAEEFKKFQETQPKAGGGGESEASAGNLDENQENSPEKAEKPQILDAWELLEPEDCSKKIDKSVETQLIDKNWKERLAGAENVKKSMENAGRIEISERLTEISKILMKIVEKDVNVNVGAISAQILAEIAKKSRFSFSALALRAFPVVFDKLKDKKAILRDALVEFCDEAANTTPLSAYSEAVITGLSNKNPQARQQTALFLSRFFAKNDPKTVETEAVKQLAEHILKTSNDADKEVREAALRIVAAVQKCLGEGVAKRLLAEVYDDKLKAEKLPPLIEELEKEFGSSASPEMLQLAKHYKIGASSTSAPPKTTAGAPKRPSSAVAPRRAPPASAAPTRRAPSPKAPVVAPTRRAPSPKAPVAPVAPVKPKPFVARPAPSFGKPRAAVAPARAPQITQRAPAATRPATSAIRVTPIAPNVVRNGAPAAPRKPIGIARPQTSSGITAPGAPRSRIAMPTSSSSLAHRRPGSASSSVPRVATVGAPMTSSSRIRPPSRPSSRPGSRNE